MDIRKAKKENATKYTCGDCKKFTMQNIGKCSRWSHIHLVPANIDDPPCDWFILRDKPLDMMERERRKEKGIIV